MKKFFLRLIINSVAFYAAMYLMQNHGIHFQDTSWVGFLVLALIFGAVNAILKPVLVVAGCPFIVLTLGFGLLIINTLLFVTVGQIGTWFNFGFTVNGFIPAFSGALIVSVVSFALDTLLKDD